MMEQLPEDMINSLPHNETIETFDDVRSMKLDDIEPYSNMDGDTFFYINRPVNNMPASYDDEQLELEYGNGKYNGFTNVQLSTVCIIFVLTIILLYGVTFTRKLN